MQQPSLTTLNDTETYQTDIAIIGAGPVGMALAAWLLRDHSWHVTLIDARMPGIPIQDQRSLAISQGSRILLENLVAWPKQATPIQTIHVSQQGIFGRTLIRHSDYGYDALGYVMPYQVLLDALEKKILTLQQANNAFDWRCGSQVTRVAETKNHESLIEISGQHSGLLRAKIVVHAEGNLFRNQILQQETLRRDYQQTALISTVTCAMPRHLWAWERFTSEGPLALLPLAHSHDPTTFALVWVGSSNTTAQRKNCSDTVFLKQLTQAFGMRMGVFQTVAERVLYPLSLRCLTSTQIQGLRVAIGNAAQTLHPVAGQGFNLGLRDAWCLAESLHHRLDASALISFNKKRATDRQRTITITDLLPRVFSTTNRPFQYLLGMGLMSLDTLPPLRHTLAKHMMFGHRV